MESQLVKSSPARRKKGKNPIDMTYGLGRSLKGEGRGRNGAAPTDRPEEMANAQADAENTGQIIPHRAGSIVEAEVKMSHGGERAPIKI